MGDTTPATPTPAASALVTDPPEPPAGSLGAVLPAAAAAIGIDHDTQIRTGEQARALLGVPQARAVCVVLVDGLGYHQMRARIGHAPFLRSCGEDITRVQAGFPATTATSLGLFGTGLAAGRTGLVGFAVRDPSTGQAVNLLGWHTAIAPEQWQPEPTVFESAALRGEPATFVGEDKFAHSGMTRAALRGARFVAASSHDAKVDRAVEALARPGPQLVYLYWGDIDKAGHRFGVDSPQWCQALEACDAALDRLARRLPRDAALIVTADHGMVDVPPSGRIDVAHRPRLVDGVSVVAGEPRAVHLFAHTHGIASDDEVGAVAHRWRTELDGLAWIFTRTEAVRAGLFGAVVDRVLPLLGDVIVAPHAGVAIVDSRTQSAAAISLIGLHGSMTQQENEVPCIIIPPERYRRG